MRRICKWFKDTNNTSKDGDITATIERPVVFHLHGHESNLKSMVLTEDDYYDFLISWVRDQDMIPPSLQKALAQTSLPFVGYRLADMSFRVLFRSVFRAMEIPNRYSNVAVQLPPEDASEAGRKYLSKYFGEDKIHVFLGERSEFCRRVSSAIPDVAIEQLVKQHLIRAEHRAGTFWYELTHDRLIRSHSCIE